jgi:hypothetical protein
MIADQLDGSVPEHSAVAAHLLDSTLTANVQDILAELVLAAYVLNSVQEDVARDRLALPANAFSADEVANRLEKLKGLAGPLFDLRRRVEGKLAELLPEDGEGAVGQDEMQRSPATLDEGPGF